jgi:hypothetical protein
MFFLNLFGKCLFVYLLTTALSFAESAYIVEHHDSIESDAALSLSKVVELTLEKYPDVTWLNSLEEEGRFFQRATAGQPVRHKQGFGSRNSGTLHYIDGAVRLRN